MESSSEPVAWIVSIEATGVEKNHFALRSSGVTTICAVGCDVTIPQTESNIRASLSFHNGQWLLRDSGAVAGTYRRIRPEKPAFLLPGAILIAGRQTLVIGQGNDGLWIDQYAKDGQYIRRHPIGLRQIVFGRNAGASHPDIGLDDQDLTLSRFHFSTVTQDAGVAVQDFGSLNGTYTKIDGELQIEHGDMFLVGKQLFQLCVRSEMTDLRTKPMVRLADPRPSAERTRGDSVLVVPAPAASPVPSPVASTTVLAPDEVRRRAWLGASLPDRAGRGSAFVARLAVYSAEYKDEVKDILDRLGRTHRSELDRASYQLTVGVDVTVRCTAMGLQVDPKEQTFSWTGEKEILDFHVTVSPEATVHATVVRFDVFAAGIPMRPLMMDLIVDDEPGVGSEKWHRVSLPRKAFASYASEDRERVLDRVDAIQILTGIDVFTDCISLRPNERWRAELLRQVTSSELFMLFWSRHAEMSEWVKWEYQAAMERPGIQAMQIHPLENVPPPRGLEMIHVASPIMAIREQAAVRASGKSSLSTVLRKLFPGKSVAYIAIADRGVGGDAAPDESVLEWAEARDVEIDNECWIGMCGCDPIRIIEGGDNLNTIGDKERNTLQRIGLEAGPYRLACMTRCSGPVAIEIVNSQ